MTVCALALMRREFLVVELVFLQKIEDLKCARSTVTEFLLAVPVLLPVLCDLKNSQFKNKQKVNNISKHLMRQQANKRERECERERERSYDDGVAGVGVGAGVRCSSCRSCCSCNSIF